MRCVRDVAQTLLMPMEHTVCLSECVATHTRNMIRGNQVSLRKILDLQKCYVFAIKRTAVMIERVTSTSIAAKV